MNANKKGYWVYSTIIAIVAFALFGFWGYLVYDLVIKLSEQDFSNNTVVQALFSLITTVFLGGYFTKIMERRNAKKIEIFKVQRDISLTIIDYSTILYYHPDNNKVKELLKAETTKVKLYFNNEVLIAINDYLSCLENDHTKERKDLLYENLSSQLKKSIK